jgi:hypothetical protein
MLPVDGDASPLPSCIPIDCIECLKSVPERFTQNPAVLISETIKKSCRLAIDLEIELDIATSAPSAWKHWFGSRHDLCLAAHKASSLALTSNGSTIGRRSLRSRGEARDIELFSRTAED